MPILVENPLISIPLFKVVCRNSFVGFLMYICNELFMKTENFLCDMSEGFQGSFTIYGKLAQHSPLNAKFEKSSSP